MRLVLAVKAEQVAGFLGNKISPVLTQEIGSGCSTRIEVTCIKHRFGKTGVRMDDKFGRVLRPETATNDVVFFKHHRTVEQKDGHITRELAPLKKNIYRRRREIEASYRELKPKHYAVRHLKNGSQRNAIRAVPGLLPSFKPINPRHRFSIANPG